MPHLSTAFFLAALKLYVKMLRFSEFWHSDTEVLGLSLGLMQQKLANVHSCS